MTTNGRLRSKFLLALVGVPFIIGAALLLLAVVAAVGALCWTHYGVPAQGRIIAMHELGSRTIVPEVQYDVAGQVFTIRPNLDRTSPPAPRYAVGDSIPVLHNQDLPERGIVNSIVELWTVPILLGVLGLVLTAVTSEPLWKHVRAVRSPE